MLFYAIVTLVIAFIAWIVYREYQNEKRYRLEQEAKRRKRRQKITPKVRKRETPAPKVDTKPGETSPAPENVQPAEEKTPTRQQPQTPAPPKTTKRATKPHAPKKETTTETSPKPSAKKSEKKTTAPSESKKTTPVSTKKPTTAPSPKKETTPPASAEEKAPQSALPSGEYPEFSYKRLLDMGLSDEEAREFVQDLIPQIDEQIPKIEEAMEIPDYHKMERLTHSIKGSSTNLGEGGVADVLVDYNTYLKSGKDMSIIRAYHNHLITYLDKLKQRFLKNEQQ